MSATVKDNGGPAFPECVAVTPAGDFAYGMAGMTLRDWFAGQALRAVATAVYAMPEAHLERSADLEGYKGSIDGFIAMRCGKLADAMIAERSK